MQGADVPVVHSVRCLSVFFHAAARGEKTFEIRKNDRGYQKGDVLELRETDPIGPMHEETGRTIRFRIGYVLNHPMLDPRYVILSLQEEQADG
jgi:ParB family transcriptional regulator, chromosome partitioning protein